MSRNTRHHCPDLALRETEDGGFSRGWGHHMLPSERYWIDSHCHFQPPHTDAAREAIVRWFERLEAWRLAQFVGIVGATANMDMIAEVAHDPRFVWLLRLRYDNPDREMCERAFDKGAAGIKLHNSDVIVGGLDCHVWENDAWARVFEVANRKHKPILWHVTQRVTASAYHGGGLHAYWEQGWEKGVTYSNEDILQSHLRLVRAYPEIPFIGAHQHYLGLERLTAFFEAYPNLYIDTSVGCVVRFGDEMYEEDKDLWRDFFICHADRILFGTDSTIGESGALFEVNIQAFLNHVRFIHQLRLPDDVLQKVAWANCARLYHLPERPTTRRSNVKP